MLQISVAVYGVPEFKTFILLYGCSTYFAVDFPLFFFLSDHLALEDSLAGAWLWIVQTELN